ncbi:hypothetical protein DUNSADRAFT_4752 [Dunaliella salina]|uniref:Encoded protein n=1 Tax=Dunaliella salina TaxID=3046 RepID=A0ABQ7GRG0_DUNSA|nr:hypothetical protein DUNSADRAFT_4752 [Dunaliella salina]|eukprot:KAF5837192.1 hypothetical protein DUNSADRAFT_4752 [Dunaliella salina]
MTKNVWAPDEVPVKGMISIGVLLKLPLQALAHRCGYHFLAFPLLIIHNTPKSERWTFYSGVSYVGLSHCTDPAVVPVSESIYVRSQMRASAEHELQLCMSTRCTRSIKFLTLFVFILFEFSNVPQLIFSLPLNA